MIYCPGCGTANREGSRYCNQCGTVLIEEETSACPRCGATNAPDAAHCENCGLGLVKGGATPEDGAEGGAGEGAAAGADRQAGAPAGPPGESDLLQLYPGGLPPWLDSVEWPGEDAVLQRMGLEPGEADDEGIKVSVSPDQWSADAIPIEPVVGVPYRARERTEPPLTAEQEAAAGLFVAAADEEVQPAPQEVLAPRRSLVRGLGLRWLTAAALLLAVIVPLLSPLYPFSGAGAVPAAAVGAVKAVSELPRGSTVLVAFEYDAGLAGEMQPIAEAFLHQLVGQGLRVVAVSTQPEGAALAEMALERVLPAHEGARYGLTAVNLGYVAGGDAGVRALAKDVRSTAPTDYRQGGSLEKLEAMEGVAGAKDLPLIVVLGRDPAAVQRWIEQLATPHATPLVAGVPALVEPALEPYRVAGQLRGVVAGIAGAAAYERLAARPGSAGRMLAAVRTGSWAVGAMVVAANLAALLGRWRRPEG